MTRQKTAAEHEIEAALDTTGVKILRLQAEIEALRAWEAELQTSLRVIRRLAGANEVLTPDLQAIETQRSTFSAHPAVERAQRPVTVAKGKAALAGEALTRMLQAKGDYIKPMEAVNRLRSEHSLVIGSAKPGRETSDLSAAIGHGKVPGLVVSRRDGWGLVEWKGVVPGPGPTVKGAASSNRVADDALLVIADEAEPFSRADDFGS